MIVRLKTWEEIEKEFNIKRSEFADHYDINGLIINQRMKKNFGRVMEMEIHGPENKKYTHVGEDGYYYHESWFKYENFIKEEDFKL